MVISGRWKMILSKVDLQIAEHGRRSYADRERF